MSARAMALGIAGLALAGCALDVDRAREYPCHPDGGAGECPGGFACYLDGRCHDPNVPVELPCQTSADCTGGWHCGPQDFCYDRGDAGAVSCRVELDADAGARDCAASFRCGLNGICHDRDAGAPYACASDPDCERGWRCGPKGACLDPALDALATDVYGGPLSATLVSPLLPAGLPDTVAASRAAPMPMWSAPADAREYAVTRGSDWTGILDHRWEADPDGGLADRVRITRAQLPAPAQGLIAVTFRDAGYHFESLALADGGLYLLEALADGGTAAPIPMEGPAFRPQRIANLGWPFFAAHAGTQFALHSWAPDGGHSIPFHIPGADGGDLEIYDVRHSSEYLGEYLIAATPDGMFWASLAKGGFKLPGGAIGNPTWSPQAYPDFPNATCSADLDAGFKVLSLYGENQWYGGPVVAAVPWGDPGGRVHVAKIGRGSGSASPGCPPPEMYAPGLDLGPCPACPDGAEFLDLALNGNYELWTRCVVQEGGRRVERLFDVRGRAPVCELGPVGGSTMELDSPRASPWRGGTAAYAGQSGNLWAIEWVEGVPNMFESLLLDHVPDVVFERFGILATSSRQGVLRSTFEEDVGLAVAERYANEVPVAAVAGRPSWILTRENVSASSEEILRVRDADTRELIAAATAPSGTFAAPYQARAIALADGGSELLVTSEDTVLAAPVRPGTATLQLRAAPQPRFAIQSVSRAPAPAGGPAPVLSVYTLGPAGLAQLTSYGDDVWMTDPIALPDGNWLEVWSDGERGRVGYRDGRVFALPSRVLIAPALGESVLDYAPYCRQAFALTATALYRLMPPSPGTSEGVWTPVPLDVGAPVDLSGGGMLRPLGVHLWLFTWRGVVVRLDAPGCAEDPP